MSIVETIINSMYDPGLGCMSLFRALVSVRGVIAYDKFRSTRHRRSPAFVLLGLARDCIACRLLSAFVTLRLFSPEIRVPSC
jgi:hypothetical protein